jgi:hypothetical protein
LGLGQFDYINRMITLYVITLSGLHCTLNCNVIKHRWKDPINLKDLNRLAL